MEPLDHETFDPIIASISDLTKGINEEEKTGADLETRHPATDPDEMLQSWLSAGPSRIEELIRNDEHLVAKAELEDVEKEIATSDSEPNLELSASLQKLRQTIESAISSMRQTPAIDTRITNGSS